LPRSFTNPPTRTAITATIRPRRSAFMAGSVGLPSASPSGRSVVREVQRDQEDGDDHVGDEHAACVPGCRSSSPRSSASRARRPRRAGRSTTTIVAARSRFSVGGLALKLNSRVAADLPLAAPAPTAPSAQVTRPASGPDRVGPSASLWNPGSCWTSSVPTGGARTPWYRSRWLSVPLGYLVTHRHAAAAPGAGAHRRPPPPDEPTAPATPVPPRWAPPARASGCPPRAFKRPPRAPATGPGEAASVSRTCVVHAWWACRPAGNALGQGHRADAGAACRRRPSSRRRRRLPAPTAPPPPRCRRHDALPEVAVRRPAAAAEAAAPGLERVGCAREPPPDVSVSRWSPGWAGGAGPPANTRRPLAVGADGRTDLAHVRRTP
jgi:hypothetical protein